jgi:hypothetical protein
VQAMPVTTGCGGGGEGATQAPQLGKAMAWPEMNAKVIAVNETAAAFLRRILIAKSPSGFWFDCIA